MGIKNDETKSPAETIKMLRERAGENRREFSAHTGIPVRTLQDWELGNRTPPDYILRMIAYQLELEDLKKEMEKNKK